MRLIPLFSLCLLGVALAYEIPHDLEDGIWHVELPDPKNHSTAILKRADPSLRPSRLFKRQEPAGFWEHWANFHGEGVSGDRGNVAWGPEIGPAYKGGNSDAKFVGLDQKPSEGHIPYSGVTDSLTPAPPGANQANDIRKFLGFNCRHNEPKMIVRDYHEAKENLYRYCERWNVNAESGHISMSKSGQVVAYMCNFHWKPQRCSKAELIFLEKRIMDAYCGQYVSAYANAITHTTVDGKRQEVEVAYGRGSGGNTICGPREGGWPYTKLNTWTGMPDPKPEPDEKQVDWKAIAAMQQANLTDQVLQAYKRSDMVKIDELLEDFFDFIHAGEAREKVKELWLRRFYIWEEARRFQIDELRQGQAMDQNNWWDDDDLPAVDGRMERRQQMRAELQEIEAQLAEFGVMKTGIKGLTDVENLVNAANLAGYYKEGS